MAPVVDRSSDSMKKHEGRTLPHLGDAIAAAVDLDIPKRPFPMKRVAKRRQAGGRIGQSRATAAEQPGEGQPIGSHGRGWTQFPYQADRSPDEGRTVQERA